jgi:hypothetical protein
VKRRRIRLAWTTRPLLVGGAAALIAWLLGVIPGDAVLIGALTALVIAVPNRLGPPEDTVWDRTDDEERPLSWVEPSRLARLLGSDDAMRHVLPRARWTARQRVTSAGLSWTDPRVRALLGPPLHDILSSTHDDIPTPSDTARWIDDLLDRLDQLDQFDAPPVPPHDATTTPEPNR